MRCNFVLAFVLLTALMLSGSVFAQHQFRAVGDGPWSETRNWQVDNGGIWLPPPEGVYPGEEGYTDVDVIIEHDGVITIDTTTHIRINSLNLSSGTLHINGRMIIGATEDDPNNKVSINPLPGGVSVAESPSENSGGVTAPAVSTEPLQLLQNIPNPISIATGDWTTFNFYVDKDYSLVRLAVYSEIGHEIVKIYEESHPLNGWKSVKWNTRSLQSGSYPVILQADNMVTRRSLTVVR